MQFHCVSTSVTVLGFLSLCVCGFTVLVLVSYSVRVSLCVCVRFHCVSTSVTVLLLLLGFLSLSLV